MLLRTNMPMDISAIIALFFPNDKLPLEKIGQMKIILKKDVDKINIVDKTTYLCYCSSESCIVNIESKENQQNLW